MQVGDTIYLDYQAATPVDERVLAKMNAAAATLFGNPHSADHVLGWRAAAAIEAAASEIGNLFQIQPDDVLFTSGASEANAMVVRAALARARNDQQSEILVGAGDHSSIINEAERSGLVVRRIRLNDEGAPDIEHLASMINDATVLVSVIGVNNENGSIADIRALGRCCKAHNVMCHVDLAQAPLAFDIDLGDLAIDYATISAHKLYGPKGVGALLIGPTAFRDLEPLIFGAGQQGGRRGGTMPTELIVGFGEACRLFSECASADRERVTDIRGTFVEALVTREAATLIGALDNRHPGNALMRFPGYDASDLLARLQPTIAASSQSACSSGSIEPSHVLLAMGLNRQAASECIRFSFGRFSTHAQANAAVEAISQVLGGIATEQNLDFDEERLTAGSQ
ncbi:aminotransferase class V-fold PLP-dependent enzyme [uncultured Roseobacter sp.]|uniref:cysteine desulfurase family protein n=1 Tax=uncultured Roseobacter sp. TaxID=114847 RepID=UPI0026159143|nr:aminotransferase class V-fold PLP-dependent enzyme [uncultured Roseobacter sp.]